MCRRRVSEEGEAACAAHARSRFRSPGSPHRGTDDDDARISGSETFIDLDVVSAAVEIRER
jgi:hypothetical protein